MTEKVLLIDDEVDFVEALAERMRARGMIVTTATSAEEAFEATDRETFDAIILDLQMPQVDGMDALRTLKKKNKDLQVILLTGHATVEKGVKAMKLGAMDLIEKPADLSVLEEKIKEAQTQRLLIVEQKAERRLRDILERQGW